MQAAIMVPGVAGGIWDIRDVQRPVVTAGHILARVHASSLNRAEMRAIRNLRLEPGKPAPAERAGGGDAAGEVVAVGAGVTGFKPGDRVMGRCSGGFAEYALIDAREAMPAPECLSWEEAACVPIVFVVVHDALYASAQLHAGESVLVTAAASGVGVATLLLAKLIGARVIGTSRSAEKLEKLKGFGLDAGVVTGSSEFGEAIARAIGEDGVDMIVDNIGGDVFRAVPQCARHRRPVRHYWADERCVEGRTRSRPPGIAPPAPLWRQQPAAQASPTSGIDKAVCRRSDAGAERRQPQADRRSLLRAERDRRRPGLSRSR